MGAWKKALLLIVFHSEDVQMVGHTTDRLEIVGGIFSWDIKSHQNKIYFSINVEIYISIYGLLGYILF